MGTGKDRRQVIGPEANLAWALALGAKPFLDVSERNALFVAVGAGETFAVVRALVKWVAIKRIPVEPDLVRQCVSWLDGYAGHDDERYLRRLIEEMVSPTEIQARPPSRVNRLSTSRQQRIQSAALSRV
jgi:hypothetical protein